MIQFYYNETTLERLKEILKLIAAVSEPPLKRLTRGAPVSPGVKALEILTPADLVAPARVVNEEAGRAVVSGLYLACDGFVQSHELAQGIPSYLGSWWHAILHRREPDATNSAHWYRKVKAPGRLYAGLGRAALEVVEESGQRELMELGEALRGSRVWEPMVFVRACARAQDTAGAAAVLDTLIRLQELEWRTLLDHSVEVATGEAP